MKRFYSLLFLWLVSLPFAEDASAQSFPYQKKWEHIERQELEGKLKSLKPEVEEIYRQSKKEQQAAHRIRALLYLLKIDMTTEGGPQRELELYRRFTNEIKTAAGVERSILQSLLAEALKEYYWHNLHRIPQRTTIHADTVSTDDLTVWSQKDYQRVIGGLCLASLENDDLKEEPADRWELLMDTAIRNRELGPTMFDILTIRASAYYMGDDRETVEKLGRNLAAFHLGEGHISAYLYNQLMISRHPQNKSGRDERIALLRSLSTAYPDNWYTSEILNELAQLYRQKMQALDREAFGLRKQYADSIMALSEIVTTKFPQSRADFSLQIMCEQILRPNIVVFTDQYVLPGQPFHAFVTHKNLHSAYVRVLPAKRSYVDGSVIKPLPNRTQQDVDSFFRTNDPLQEYEISLTHSGDYENRSTFVALNPLPGGEYLIAVSDNSRFLADSGVVTFHYIGVTRNALAFRHDELLLTDRQTGKAQSGQKVSVYIANNKSRSPSVNGQGLQLLQQVTTDKDGMAALTLIGNKHLRQRWSELFFRVGDDPVLTASILPTLSESLKQTDTIRKTHFLTDRAIYRPGQTLYFKGIYHEQVQGGYGMCAIITRSRSTWWIRTL